MEASQDSPAPVGRERSRAMTFLSLFSGIGGLDLGLERAGMRCVGQVEINPFGRAVLAKHWPDVPKFEDVRNVKGDNFSETIDLIAGGFPCQDISNMGHMAGLDGDRSGLWAEYRRLVGDIRPRYVFVENVAALLIRGMDRVLGDLATLGFDAEWSVVSACAMGAPHTRERVFIVANAAGCGRFSPSLAHTSGRDADGREAGPFEAESAGGRDCPVGRGWWVREPEVARMVDGSAALMDGPNRALGNAVVPQVAEWIGHRIIEADRRHPHRLSSDRVARASPL